MINQTVVLFNENLGSFFALNADVEAVIGVGYAYALEVVVLDGSVGFVNYDVVDTGFAVDIELDCAGFLVGGYKLEVLVVCLPRQVSACAALVGNLGVAVGVDGDVPVAVAFGSGLVEVERAPVGGIHAVELAAVGTLDGVAVSGVGDDEEVLVGAGDAAVGGNILGVEVAVAVSF